MSKPVKHAPCAIHGLLQDLTRPWTLHILYALCHNGPARFGILRLRVDGISSRVLTERLRLLEQKGFVYRRYESTIPPSALRRGLLSAECTAVLFRSLRSSPTSLRVWHSWSSLGKSRQ